MKLVLTSDGLSTKLLEDQFISLFDGKVSAVKTCVITTASQYKGESNSARNTKETLLRLGFGSCDLIDIEYQDAEQLSVYDVIYINGGNPFYLLLWMRRSNAIHLLKALAAQGKVIVGTSAGAMVLAESISHVNELNRIAGYDHMDLAELEDYDAIGLTRWAAVPHYNRFISANPQFENQLTTLEKERNLEFQRINDGEAVVINNDVITKWG